MKVAALFSGGKDSAYAAWLAMQHGWEVARLVTIRTANPDSFMFHHANVELTTLQAEAAGIPHRFVESKGEKEKEVADLKRALSGLGIDGVVSGAIESEYQKERVDLTCEELGLKSFAPLWRKPQERVALEEAGSLEAVIVSVSAEGLGEGWLGRPYDEKCVRDLIRLREETGISVCGEGGEFETLVLNAPFFSKRLRLRETKTVWRGSSGTMEAAGAELSPTR